MIRIIIEATLTFKIGMRVICGSNINVASKSKSATTVQAMVTKWDLPTLDFEKALTSAGWIQEIENHIEDDEEEHYHDDEEECHCECDCEECNCEEECRSEECDCEEKCHCGCECSCAHEEN